MRAFWPEESFFFEDDIKAVIPPRNWEASAVSLTIGIGNDLSVEHRLKRTFPNTRFYGVGISETGGTINASVMDSEGQYVWQTIPTITMANLLAEFGLSEVDYLFVDIEGTEYFLLPKLFLHANQIGGIICQVLLLLAARTLENRKKSELGQKKWEDLKW
ncbi:unnamed protein product [Gongylonema pulchrum]|uniref:Methyltransferase FkbM domain-containing protein n=1 Tax=Gongylonema pulchrum TaxID=637853 RepID=A0A3P6RQ89_9BILA|nr:unnamed protein product [Gongylonema pulchrum]